MFTPKNIQGALEELYDLCDPDYMVDMLVNYSEEFDDISPALLAKSFQKNAEMMLNEFIDKIVIFEATGGRTVNRSQRIDIYFNFIGQFVVEDTEEESLSRQEEEKRLAELKEQERKDRRNETVRRYRQRKKEKKAAEAEAEKTAERNIA